LLLNDKEIKELCVGDNPMLAPFVSEQKGKPSFGLGSAGYDLCLGGMFLLHKPHLSGTLDPLNVNNDLFKEIHEENIFYIRPHTQVLAESIEWFDMPDNVMSIILGKSSYARLGLLVNATPAEPMWAGHLTLELANLSSLPIALHVGQGIAQALFFKVNRPERGYTEKESGGIYQNQQGVQLPV
jgi:dCTP deaminase